MVKVANELLAVLASVVYLLMTGYEDDVPLEIFMVVKALPPFVLAHSTANVMLMIGLFLSGCSSAILEIDDRLRYESDYFFMGLGLQFMAIFCYLRYFMESKQRGEDGILLRSPLYLMLVITLMFAVLWPCLDVLYFSYEDTSTSILLLGYGCLLGGVNYNAFLTFTDTGCWEGLVGILLFTASNSCMAFDKFVNHFENAVFLCHCLYYPSIILLGRCAPNNKSDADNL
jgi:hypothetical protein